MLNLRLSAYAPTTLAALLSLCTSAASIRLVLGIKGLLCCFCADVTNADFCGAGARIRAHKTRQIIQDPHEGG